MTRESVDVKARRYLAEGRLQLHRIDTDEIRGHCRGDGATYSLGWNPADRWWCSCPAARGRCAHLVALKLVAVRRPATSS